MEDEKNVKIVEENTELEIQTTFNEDGLDVLVEDGTIENENAEEPEGIGAGENFSMRTSKPGAGNKFFITRSRGGYSTCIQGSPTDSKCNVLANCVGYACGRFNEIIGAMKYPSLNCNAENFIERARNTYGLEISPVPTLGGIMVWQKGSTLSGGDGAGHVAIVEKIIDSNTIYTSESGYGSSAFWNSTRSNSNGRWGLGSGYTFRGCIVNPAIGKVTAPTSNSANPFPGVSDEELARRVWSGEFGNGTTRQERLGSRYAAVQALVNRGVGKPGTTSNVPYAGVSDEELARRVWSGEFGNGTTRQERLGSRYAAVQALVNRGVGKPGTTSNVPYAGVSDEELARRVWRGEFGNGATRRQKLGSRYAAVQALVNRGVGR